MNAAKQDDLRRRLRHAAERGADDEQQEAAGVKPAPAKHIAETPCRDDQSDQSQIVNEQYPLNGGEIGLKIARQGGQSDEQRALIQTDDKLAKTGIEQD